MVLFLTIPGVSEEQKNSAKNFVANNHSLTLISGVVVRRGE
jgi:hypothetical protein